MQMRFNKKGQEGFSTTGVLAMIVGVIALVVIGIFIYNAYSKPKEISKLFPNEFQTALTACSGFVDKLEDYCLYYVPFDEGSVFVSKMSYYNCMDLENQAGKINTRCNDEKYAFNKCLKLVSSGEVEVGKTVYVSGKSCNYVSVANSSSIAGVRFNGVPLNNTQLVNFPSLLNSSA